MGRLLRLSLLALLAWVAVAPAPAHAGWVRSRVPRSDGSYCGTCEQLFWCGVRSLGGAYPNRKVPFTINEAGSKDAGATASIEAARQSFSAWSAPVCTDLEFVDQGTSPRYDIGYAQTATDNLNLVVWRESSCSRAAPAGAECFQTGGCNNLYDCWEGSLQTIALTTTTFNNKTGEVLDADIELNGAGFVFSTVDGAACSSPPPRPATNCVATDVRNTLTHEIGHIVGLDHPDLSPESTVDHTNDREDTMYSSASLGDTNKRTLHQDDIDGLCAIYPKDVKTPACLKPEDLRGDCGCSTAGAPLAGLSAALFALLGVSRRRRNP
ncbi:MAG TPA: myxosortase-dependent metalloprotease, MXAN_2677/MXAN_2678 family [Myxococcales bacterium]|jgi:MYXO-CTERM domain-containing protein